MIELHLDDSDLQRGLGRLLSNARNPAPMMKGIAEELHNATKDNFHNEAWGSSRWPKSKAAAERKGKTLYDTGELYDSITTKTGPRFARIGSNMKYAAIHHMGGQAGRGRKLTLPARPYLPVRGDGKLQPKLETNLLEIALECLKKGVVK